MSEGVESRERVPLARDEARRLLRERLSELGEPLQILAEEIRGEGEALIDWVAVLPSGRAVVGLLRGDGKASALLCEGLVQRAWVEARLRDWQKLAPGLGVRPELRPILLLLAPSFSRRLRIAAREADPELLWLVAYRWERRGSELRPLLDPLRLPSAGAAVPPPPPRPLRSSFRTGLREEDLRLSSS